MERFCKNCRYFTKFEWSYKDDHWTTCYCFRSPYEDKSLGEVKVEPGQTACEHFEKGESE